jgi:uncharacterized repeat protein (TIGR03833 family)
MRLNRSLLHDTQNHDQGSGNLTQGIVRKILIGIKYNLHGIKVEIEHGEIGRAQNFKG